MILQQLINLRSLLLVSKETYKFKVTITFVVLRTKPSNTPL